MHWLVVGASPDLRQQILDNPVLHPRRGPRGTPIIGVALVSADIDGIAGLFALRERQDLVIYAPGSILEVLRDNAVFDVLDPALVRQVEVQPGRAVNCGHGLSLALLPMPGKLPLYLEDRAAADAEPGPAYAAMVRAHSRTAVMAPACAEVTDAVRAQFDEADLVFFDGTLYTDDEMRTAGVGTKSGRRMGHAPMSGPAGSLARLKDLPGRLIYLHINNTNPVLLADSPERAEVEKAGFEIAYDGMEVRL